MSTMKYDAAFIEKPGELGLTQEDITSLLDQLNGDEVYPIEISNYVECNSAMGFITTTAAKNINFEYGDRSDFGNYIAYILSDTENESPDGTYKIQGLNVLVTKYRRKAFLL